MLENCFLINFSKNLNKMVLSCCAVGCTNRFKSKAEGGVGFFRFPNKKKEPWKRQLWIIAVRRAFWEPTPYSRICGDHFQNGNIVSLPQSYTVYFLLFNRM